jgi:hypothetical protein
MERTSDHVTSINTCRSESMVQLREQQHPSPGVAIAMDLQRRLKTDGM